MQTYPRPQERHVSVTRQDVDGQCPECDSGQLKSYPVLSEGGWWNVTKCQSCLCSVDREPGNLLGAIQMLVEAV
jgi:vanillate/4-hydroxybenzoate decarboxylase subunit D